MTINKQRRDASTVYLKRAPSINANAFADTHVDENDECAASQLKLCFAIGKELEAQLSQDALDSQKFRNWNFGELAAVFARNVSN
ncbi:hypothetical protein DDE82_006642 [Stemphylium lycopersici]|uniref:Uncharacterized protein n=1 Tax=Stemphylium lycopersici TaxID=183478 RepID=A0A364N140_STELY|nr:hypothetical protein TW65_04929 [Stemphylium lycopersici]RAR01300.1 hypothetical protein DDE82_006642 [Stemphylium lycopersici]RAR08735.1 hypothetical protein DDE83_005859 [Stemphylium lycopersici]